jgi:predicted RNA binding protein YcfA (HicA-like mRNA interferase family)
VVGVGGTDKLERAIRRSPSTVRLDDVRSLLESAGWNASRGSQGHRIFTHPRFAGALNVPEPHGRGDRFVRPHYVRKVLAALDQVRGEGKEE